MSHHEPCSPCEVFVGNCHGGLDAHLAWLHANGVTSARSGRHAFDIEGHPLPGDYRPVFIRGSQMREYDAAMTHLP